MKDLKPYFQRKKLLENGNFAPFIWKKTIFGEGNFIEVCNLKQNFSSSYNVNFDSENPENFMDNSPWFITEISGKTGKAAFNEKELQAIASEASAQKIIEILTSKGKFYRITYKAGSDTQNKAIFVY